MEIDCSRTFNIWNCTKSDYEDILNTETITNLLNEVISKYSILSKEEQNKVIKTIKEIIIKEANIDITFTTISKKDEDELCYEMLEKAILIILKNDNIFYDSINFIEKSYYNNIIEYKDIIKQINKDENNILVIDEPNYKLYIDESYLVEYFNISMTL